MKNRMYKFDNIKAVLIFLVVFGHFLECVFGYKDLYLFIYTFHMPLFIFVSGYFAKYNRRKIVTDLIYPYVVFQILYTLFEIYLLGDEKLKLTFVRPRWILWYMVAIIAYYLLIPLFDVKSSKNKIIVLGLMIMISLLVGYDYRVGYDLALSRILVFMPFFFAGFYAKKEALLLKIKSYITRKTYLIALTGYVLFVKMVDVIIKNDVFNEKILYGSCSYEISERGVGIRILMIMIAMISISLVLLVVPDKRIPILSNIGMYTMPVFLIHGFIVKYCKYYLLENEKKMSIQKALLFSIITVLLLGNKFLSELYKPLFSANVFLKKNK